MKSGRPTLFWDTNVFCTYLYEQEDAYRDHIRQIGQFIREAHAGQWRIITSGIVFSEIAFSKIKKEGLGSHEDLLEEIQALSVVMAPGPNIMILAGRLRDIPYKKGGSRRPLSVPDAIMLATAIVAEDEYGQRLDAFHTFDAGKGKPKSVPILGYEEWCTDLSGESRDLADRVVQLPRRKPAHPTPDLLDNS